MDIKTKLKRLADGPNGKAKLQILEAFIDLCAAADAGFFFEVKRESVSLETQINKSSMTETNGKGNVFHKPTAFF